MKSFDSWMEGQRPGAVPLTASDIAKAISDYNQFLAQDPSLQALEELKRKGRNEIDQRLLDLVSEEQRPKEDKIKIEESHAGIWENAIKQATEELLETLEQYFVEQQDNPPDENGFIGSGDE